MFICIRQGRKFYVALSFGLVSNDPNSFVHDSIAPMFVCKKDKAIKFLVS